MYPDNTGLQKSSNIIGIDPGLRKTGWAVLRITNSKNLDSILDCGVIKTSNNVSLPERLAILHLNITQILNQYNPYVVSMEKVFINKNADTSLLLCQARGAILAAIAIKKINIQEFATNSIKKTVTGNGHASKDEIQKMLFLITKHSFLSSQYDISDAVAAALCFIMHNTNIQNDR